MKAESYRQARGAGTMIHAVINLIWRCYYECMVNEDRYRWLAIKPSMDMCISTWFNVHRCISLFLQVRRPRSDDIPAALNSQCPDLGLHDHTPMKRNSSL